jgi:hypothetical protein
MPRLGFLTQRREEKAEDAKEERDMAESRSSITERAWKAQADDADTAQMLCAFR